MTEYFWTNKIKQRFVSITLSQWALCHIWLLLKFWDEHKIMEWHIKVLHQHSPVSFFDAIWMQSCQPLAVWNLEIVTMFAILFTVWNIWTKKKKKKRSMHFRQKFWRFRLLSRRYYSLNIRKLIWFRVLRLSGRYGTKILRPGGLVQNLESLGGLGLSGRVDSPVNGRYFLIN